MVQVIIQVTFSDDLTVSTPSYRVLVDGELREQFVGRSLEAGEPLHEEALGWYTEAASRLFP